MHKIWVILLAAAGLGALGWWGYQSQRIGPRPALEITAGNEAGGAARIRALRRDDRRRAGRGRGAGTGAGQGDGDDQGRGHGQGRRSGGRIGAGGRGPVGVEAATAEQMPLADDVFAVGTLRANESVVMKPEIAGRIVDIGFRDGASVRKGAVLVRLDDSGARGPGRAGARRARSRAHEFRAHRRPRQAQLRQRQRARPGRGHAQGAGGAAAAGRGAAGQDPDRGAVHRRARSAQRQRRRLREGRRGAGDCSRTSPA